MATLENQKKIKWLKRYIKINDEIDRMCEESDSLRDMATKITQSFSGMPGGGQTSDKISDSVTRLCDLENKINKRVKDLTQVHEEIYYSILNIPDEKLQQLLQYRYIDGLTWEKIAVKFQYADCRYIYRLHGRALEELTIVDHP